MEEKKRLKKLEEDKKKAKKGFGLGNMRMGMGLKMPIGFNPMNKIAFPGKFNIMGAGAKKTDPKK